MCGIAGYSGKFDSGKFESVVDALKHRGPDSGGILRFGDTAIGNRRLSIIDLSNNARQPIMDETNSLAITFNGEIYNFAELRHQLSSKYKFASKSDTEVVLYAYKEWGVKCLPKLKGMFAFVIYDVKQKTLFGARDHTGQKPLKYYFKDKRFVFASEIKAILKMLDGAPEIDEKAIDHFLTLQYVPAPRTGFKDIYKLPAGHYFLYKDGQLNVKKYWSLDFSSKITLSEQDWIARIYDELARSVESHMVSDVPVGALLSGGLDSSVVVGLMSMISNYRIDTFSLAIKDPNFDESLYAKQVSDHYSTRHHKVTVSTNDLISTLRTMHNVYDEPMGDNSVLPMLVLSKLVGKTVKVALTGDGGDENFAGYDRYMYILRAVALRKYLPGVTPTLGSAARLVHLMLRSKTSERLERFLGTLSEPNCVSYLNYLCFFTNSVKHGLYTKEFLSKVKESDTFKLYCGYSKSSLSELDNALLTDINTYLPDDLLYKSDSASMAYGLELRSPMLDHQFMETMAAIPSDLKIRNGEKKYIFKKMVEKYNLLPEEIIYRKKQGFTVPLAKLLKKDLRSYLEKQILSGPLVTKKIFSTDKLEKYLDDYFTSNLNYDNNIFALVSLSLWLDTYF